MPQETNNVNLGKLGPVIMGALDTILCWLVAIGLMAMSAILMIQVMARYIANSPTVWSEELAVSLFVWVAMLAIPLGLRRGEHLTLDLLNRHIPPLANKVLAVVIATLSVLTFALIGYFAFKLLPTADRQLLAGIAGGLAIQAKVSWVYLAIPVGSALAIVFTIERLVLLLGGKVRFLNVDADQLIVDGADSDRDTPASENSRNT